MTQEEKNQKLFQIYAALGELSVLKKQSEQRLDLINAQVDRFEKDLVDLTAQEVAKTEEAKPELAKPELVDASEDKE